MDRFRKHKDLDDGHLPLREFVAPEGRRSRSLSLERSDSRFDSPLDRVDDKDEGMRFRVQQTASPLLDHTGDIPSAQKVGDYLADRFQKERIGKQRRPTIMLHIRAI